MTGWRRGGRGDWVGVVWLGWGGIIGEEKVLRFFLFNFSFFFSFVCKGGLLSQVTKL